MRGHEKWSTRAGHDLKDHRDGALRSDVYRNRRGAACVSLIKASVSASRKARDIVPRWRRPYTSQAHGHAPSEEASCPTPTAWNASRMLLRLGVKQSIGSWTPITRPPMWSASPMGSNIVTENRLANKQ